MDSSLNDACRFVLWQLVNFAIVQHVHLEICLLEDASKLLNCTLQGLTAFDTAFDGSINLA